MGAGLQDGCAPREGWRDQGSEVGLGGRSGGNAGKAGPVRCSTPSPRSALSSPHALRLPRAAAGRGGVPGSALGAPASQAGELVPEGGNAGPRVHPSPLRTKPARPSLVPKAPSPDPQPLQGSAGPVSSGLLSAVFGPCTAWAKPQKAKEPHFLRTWAFLLLPLLKIPLNWHLLLPGRFQHVGRRGAWKLLDGIWIHGA